MKKIIILCGAAGTGKTTVQTYLQTRFNLARVVTHTTRLPRKGEVNGRDYYFETPASMAKLHLLEKVEYDHHQYGSSKEGLERALADHPGAVIVLDTKGATTYQQVLGEQVVVVFLTVSPSTDLGHRLANRGDDPAKIHSRLTSAEFQRDLSLPMALQGKAVVINNDDWEQTKRRLDQLMVSVLSSKGGADLWTML